MLKRMVLLSLTAVLGMAVLAPVWASAQVSADQQNLRRGQVVRPGFRSGGGDVVRRPATDTVSSFPSASSTIVGSVGFIDAEQVGYFWSTSRGDSVTETLSGPASISSYTLDVDVITNVLNGGAFVNWQVTINNTVVDSFTVNEGFVGTVSRNATFPAISGPNYTVKLRVTNEVGSGFGSHTFRYAGAGLHQVDLIGGGPVPTLTSVDPSQGAPGTTVYVTLQGTNFVIGSTTVQVSGGGVTVPVVNVDGQGTSNQITAKLVIDSGAALGGRDLTVTTPAGTSNALTFTIRRPDVSVFKGSSR